MSINPANDSEGSLPRSSLADQFGSVLGVLFRVERQRLWREGKATEAIPVPTRIYQELRTIVESRYCPPWSGLEPDLFSKWESEFVQRLGELPAPLQEALDPRNDPMRPVWESRTMPTWCSETRYVERLWYYCELARRTKAEEPSPARVVRIRPVALPDICAIIELVARAFVEYAAVQLLRELIPPGMEDPLDQRVRAVLLTGSPDWPSKLHTDRFPWNLHELLRGIVPILPLKSLLADVVAKGAIEVRPFLFPRDRTLTCDTQPFYWLPTARVEADSPDNEKDEEPPSDQVGSLRTAKPKRGRPVDTDPEGDKRLHDAWATKSYKVYAELARAKAPNLSARDVRWAVDRHRKRETRKR